MTDYSPCEEHDEDLGGRGQPLHLFQGRVKEEGCTLQPRAVNQFASILPLAREFMAFM